MAMFNDPNARVRKPGPNIVPVSGAAPEIPGGGMTLDALMARQKAVAGQRIPMGEMRSPMQGAAYALERGLQGFQEGMLQRHEGEARDALAKAMTQIDPVTGQYSPEAMATIGALMPEQAFKISADTVNAAREQRRLEQGHTWDVEGREDTQAATSNENALNRAADEARARMQEAAAAGRQEDQQQAAEDLARVNAELDIAKSKLASEQKIAEIAPTNEARRQEALKLNLKEGTPEYNEYVATGDMPKAGQTIINNLGGSTELSKEFDKGSAKVYSDYLKEGSTAASLRQKLELVDALNPAAQGPLVGRLAQAFPGVDSSAAAFESLVKQMAPQQREPGSGSTSDIEYNGMLQAMPSLINRPEANRLISGMIKGQAQISIDRAAAVNEWASSDRSATAENALRAKLSEINSRSIMSPELQAMIDEVNPGGAATAPAANPALEDALKKY